MADALPVGKYYQLKGINQKISKYQFPITEFLDIRNMDFDVPGALQKRPGQTYGINLNQNSSGAVNSLFEFQRLTGESYIVGGNNLELFYLTGGNINQLSFGWNNGQPVDFASFVNTLWAANGQSFIGWRYSGPQVYPAGLPCPLLNVTMILGASQGLVPNGVSLWTTFGSFTTAPTANVGVGIFAAYNYIRADGYIGPLDLTVFPRNIAGASMALGASSGVNITSIIVSGFTAPNTNGITGFGIYLGFYPWTLGNYQSIFGVPPTNYGSGLSGFLPINGGETLGPNADLSRFFLFTTMPASTLTLTIGFGTYAFSSLAGTAQQFSGMPFCWFNTNIPRYIEVNENVMFMAGFSNNPSVEWLAEVGAPETILPESNFEVRTDDSDRITGMKAFQGQMIITKQHSFHKFIGTDVATGQLVEISSDYGCLSNKTIITYRQKIMWLDRKGILEYNGATFDIISTPIEGIFRRMNIAAAMDQACAVHHIYRNQIWFGIPIDGSTINNFTVVFDYSIGDWTFFDGFNPASFAFMKGPLNKPTVWRGDYSGFIHYYGESFYADSGTGITCLATTRFENVGGENQTTLWRRYFLDVATAPGGITGIINAQVFSNYDTSTVQATFTIYQQAFQTRGEMGVVGKAIAVQFSHFSASLPLLINGYAWANRGLRNV